jgi:hypothetical protein
MFKRIQAAYRAFRHPYTVRVCGEWTEVMVPTGQGFARERQVRCSRLAGHSGFHTADYHV